MAFSDFSLDDLQLKFGISNKIENLFTHIQPIFPDEILQNALMTAKELPIRSEKAKSEMIVLPILLGLRRINHKYFTIYSGDTLIGDEQNGLKGECDFILSKDIQSFSINYPIIQIVEAKRNDVEEGIKQCAAQLLGARMFNERKGVHLEKLYGCATTGDDWIFLKLENNTIFIDIQKYYLVEIEELLGIFQSIIDYYKPLI